MSVQNNDNTIETIVEGLKALDDPKTSKAIFIRDLSMRILLVAYLSYIFLSQSNIVLASMVGLGATFLITQFYITATFQYRTKFSVTEWYILFKQRSKFSKFFFIFSLLLLLALTIEVIVLFTIEIPEIESPQESILESLAIILFIITFLLSSLLDVLTSKLMKERAKTEFDSSLTQTSTQIDYKKLAINIISNSKVQTDESNKTSMSISMSDEETKELKKQEALREKAREKLENIDSNTESLAFSPEELDVLTEEELEALLPDESNSNTDDFQYQWELQDKF